MCSGSWEHERVGKSLLYISLSQHVSLQTLDARACASNSHYRTKVRAGFDPVETGHEITASVSNIALLTVQNPGRKRCSSLSETPRLHPDSSENRKVRVHLRVQELFADQRTQEQDYVRFPREAVRKQSHRDGFELSSKGQFRQQPKQPQVAVLCPAVCRPPLFNNMDIRKARFNKHLSILRGKKSPIARQRTVHRATARVNANLAPSAFPRAVSTSLSMRRQQGSPITQRCFTPEKAASTGCCRSHESQP